MAQALICRDGWDDISVETNVEEIYDGSGASDDPSHATVSEEVTILETVGPFKQGDKLFLTDDERKRIEDEEYQQSCSDREDSWAEYMADRYNE